MKLELLSDPKIVTDFLLQNSGSGGTEFLCSLKWQDLLSKEGQDIRNFGLYNNQELVAVFNLIKKTIKPFSFYYYSPKGPVFKKELNSKDIEDVYLFLTEIFKKEGAIFWRLEPENLPSNLKNLKKTIDLQPKKTLVLDLSLGAEKILADCHPKTRYNIRLAEKKGVEIFVENSEDHFESFWSLMSETASRDAFKVHSRSHYHHLTFYHQDFIKLLVAKKDHEVLAAGLFSFYGDRVTYLHGGSSYKYRHLMAPHLLQWTAINLGLDLGFKHYDFYGIDENKWPGVTRFKKGFGGEEKNSAGTWDLIFKKKKYFIYNLLRKIRRLV